MFRLRTPLAAALLAVTAISCGGASASKLPAPAAVAEAASPAPREAELPKALETPKLPPVLEARVGAAMKALSLFEGDFPGLSTFRSCVLVFEPSREWIFQCPELAKAKGFEEASTRFHDVPVFTAKTFSIPGQTVAFDDVKTIVGRAGRFALPDERGEKTTLPFFLVQDLDSLRSHHPAFTETSAEEWTAIFVHEYFHVFQFAQPRVLTVAQEWPKDWPQREVHGKFFTDNAAYRDAVTAEVAILRESLASPSKGSSKAVLAKWLAARDRRTKAFSDAFAKTSNKGLLAPSDAFFTFLEGTARYLEVRVLCDESLARPDMKADPDFRDFAEFKGCGPTKVPGRDRISPDFHYVIGALVATHLDVANPDWKKTIFSRPEFLVEEARLAAR